jgi:AraC-like DNA-binding protein
MRKQISTTELPTSQRFRFWSEVVDNYFVKLDCRIEPVPTEKAKDGLVAQLNHAQLGSLDLLEVQAHPQTVVRNPLRGQDEDYFLFHLQTQGDCQIIQDDRKIVIRPGEMAMYDTRRPYQVSLREEFRMRTVRIPVELLRLQLPHPERLVASPVLPQGFVGRFLGKTINSLFDEHQDIPQEQGSALAKATVEMVALGLQSVLPADEALSSSRMCQYHLERIKHCISCHLGNAELNVEWLAVRLRMSVSSIHRAFECESQTVTEYIWNKRLDACKEALANHKLQRRSISDIAYDWGFSSNAHFSRAFKRHTGMSPRDFKAGAMQSNGRSSL